MQTENPRINPILFCVVPEIIKPCSFVRLYSALNHPNLFDLFKINICLVWSWEDLKKAVVAVVGAASNMAVMHSSAVAYHIKHHRNSLGTKILTYLNVYSELSSSSSVFFFEFSVVVLTLCHVMC